MLVVNNKNLIELEDDQDFPYCGSPVEIEEEVKQVQRLLMKGTPPNAPGLGVATAPAAAASAPSPTLHRSQSEPKPRKPKASKKDLSLPLASYGHSSERVKEIEEANERLVQRLVHVATAPLSLKTVAEEHDKVRKRLEFMLSID